MKEADIRKQVVICKEVREPGAIWIVGTFLLASHSRVDILDCIENIVPKSTNNLGNWSHGEAVHILGLTIGAFSDSFTSREQEAHFVSWEAIRVVVGDELTLIIVQTKLTTLVTISICPLWC